MSEMIERVREAFVSAYFGPARQSEDWAGDVARAIVTAMREPTDFMAEYNGYTKREAHADLWRSMIDAALVVRRKIKEPMEPNA